MPAGLFSTCRSQGGFATRRPTGNVAGRANAVRRTPTAVNAFVNARLSPFRGADGRGKDQQQSGNRGLFAEQCLPPQCRQRCRQSAAGATAVGRVRRAAIANCPVNQSFSHCRRVTDIGAWPAAAASRSSVRRAAGRARRRRGPAAARETSVAGLSRAEGSR
jgi:hypothetical protein